MLNSKVEKCGFQTPRSDGPISRTVARGAFPHPFLPRQVSSRLNGIRAALNEAHLTPVPEKFCTLEGSR